MELVEATQCHLGLQTTADGRRGALKVSSTPPPRPPNRRTKILEMECQIVSRCTLRSYFKTFSEKMLAIARINFFIVACQTYRVARAWVHVFMISTTVQSFKRSTADRLSLPAAFPSLLLSKTDLTLTSS